MSVLDIEVIIGPRPFREATFDPEGLGTWIVPDDPPLEALLNLNFGSTYLLEGGYVDDRIGAAMTIVLEALKEYGGRLVKAPPGGGFFDAPDDVIE